jgi:NitT/TauT family transport system substrate-binding protein
MYKKNVKMIAVVCLAVGLLSACSSKNVEPVASSKASETAPATLNEKVSFKMGVEPWIGYGPWWIAAEKGIFEKHGLDVKVEQFNQDSDINAAFASNNIQSANIATSTAIKMVGNNGIDLSAVVFLDESHKADAILASKEITEVGQLKGKKVAFEEGSTSDLLLRQALIDNKMNPNDVKFVFMPASDAGLALLSKKVDAAVTYEPYISAVMKKGEVHILYSGENSPGLISDTLVVKSEFLTAHPSIKEQLQQVWDESLQYWKDHKDEGNKIMSEKTGVTIEDLPVVLQGLKFYSVDEQKKSFESGDLLKAAKNIQQILLKQEVVKKEIDLLKLIQIK